MTHKTLMDNIETANVLLQICNLQTIEVSKAIFGTKCLNIFATGFSNIGKGVGRKITRDSMLKSFLSLR